MTGTAPVPFTADDYKVFHPGGHLGRKLFRVDELMHVGDELPVVAPDTPMSDVVLTMTQKTFGVAGVVDAKGGLYLTSHSVDPDRIYPVLDALVFGGIG